MCYGTPDAEGEHRRLQAHGFEPQPLVDLQRRVNGATAQFKVVRLPPEKMPEGDRKSTRLNSSHLVISYAVFCLKKKKNYTTRLKTSYQLSNKTDPLH